MCAGKITRYRNVFGILQQTNNQPQQQHSTHITRRTCVACVVCVPVTEFMNNAFTIGRRVAPCASCRRLHFVLGGIFRGQHTNTCCCGDDDDCDDVHRRESLSSAFRLLYDGLAHISPAFRVWMLLGITDICIRLSVAGWMLATKLNWCDSIL